MNNPNIRFISKDKFKFQKNLPLVIGFFDGVHKGHLNLFKKINSKFNVLTFENVPAKNKTIFTLAARLTNLSFVSK
jgi:riboflavin kinase/FMN adenylyltransferase